METRPSGDRPDGTRAAPRHAAQRHPPEAARTTSRPAPPSTPTAVSAPRVGAKRDLVTAAIPTALPAFALPTLGSSVLQSLSGSINAIWVGRFLGANALAATANGNIVMFLPIAFVFGFGTASTILIGQASGRGDVPAVRRIAGAATATAIASWTSLVALIAWTYARDLPLRLRGAELRELLPDLAILRSVVSKGLPIGLQMIVISSAALVRAAGSAWTRSGGASPPACSRRC